MTWIITCSIYTITRQSKNLRPENKKSQTLNDFFLFFFGDIWSLCAIPFYSFYVVVFFSLLNWFWVVFGHLADFYYSAVVVDTCFVLFCWSVWFGLVWLSSINLSRFSCFFLFIIFLSPFSLTLSLSLLLSLSLHSGINQKNKTKKNQKKTKQLKTTTTKWHKYQSIVCGHSLCFCFVLL